MTQFYKKFQVSEKDQGRILVDFLVENCPLSKEKLKTLLNFGGVWASDAKYPKRPRKRIRRAQKEIMVNEVIEVYYDEKIFLTMKEFQKLTPEQKPQILKDGKSFSCWYKPSFILSQGTDYGDEGSILRVVEKAKGEAYLIHRLDREVNGIMVFAHDGKTAAKLSEVFRNREIKKKYVALVKKNFSPNEMGVEFKITHSLDGKKAETLVTPLRLNPEGEGTYLSLTLLTGRKHQIRRHLQMEGMSIVGDLRYNKEKSDGESKTEIKLWATELEFSFNGKIIHCQIDKKFF